MESKGEQTHASQCVPWHLAGSTGIRGMRAIPIITVR